MDQQLSTNLLTKHFLHMHWVQGRLLIFYFLLFNTTNICSCFVKSKSKRALPYADVSLAGTRKRFTQSTYIENFNKAQFLMYKLKASEYLTNF